MNHKTVLAQGTEPFLLTLRLGTAASNYVHYGDGEACFGATTGWGSTAFKQASVINSD